MTTTHPTQPLETDPRGVVRFKANAIVRYLLDAGPFDMNHLATRDFSDDDMRQFAQLIGYSLSGYGDLSYVDDVAWAAAAAQETGEAPTFAAGYATGLTRALDAIRELLENDT